MPLPRNVFFVYSTSFPLLKYSPISAVNLPAIFAWSDLFLHNTSSGCLIWCFTSTNLKTIFNHIPYSNPEFSTTSPSPVAAGLFIFSPTPPLHVDISNHIHSSKCIVLYPTPAAILLVGHVPSTVILGDWAIIIPFCSTYRWMMPMSGIVPILCAVAADGEVQLPEDSKHLSKLIGARACQAARSVGYSCLTGIFFEGSKTEKNRIPEDFFFGIIGNMPHPGHVISHRKFIKFFYHTECQTYPNIKLCNRLLKYHIFVEVLVKYTYFLFKTVIITHLVFFTFYFITLMHPW